MSWTGKRSMNYFTDNHKLIRTFAAILLAGLFLSGNIPIFTLVYVFTFIIMVTRVVITNSTKRMRFFLFLTYAVMLAIQITYMALVIFDMSETNLIMVYVRRLFGTVLVIFPWIIERVFTSRKETSFTVPSVQEMSTISMNELKENKERITDTIENLKKTGQVLTTDNINEIITDLPRHDSFKYINNGNLTDEYFSLAIKSLDDPYVYIVLSDTGSPASGIISVFTGKPYNHVSISFDSELKTIISYNGGEKVYPPGLNREMLDFFNKKDDASIIIYRLPITKDKKMLLINNIKDINEEGSAYNLMGLVTKRSHRPNILFCSQFVYKMLKLADIQYFDKKDGEVKPTDFVELDYHRKLEYVSEIKLNQ